MVWDTFWAIFIETHQVALDRLDFLNTRALKVSLDSFQKRPSLCRDFKVESATFFSAGIFDIVPCNFATGRHVE
jgi:hypothetical protein